MHRCQVAELAARISADFADKEVIFVGLLKGAFIFMADLMRQLSIPFKVLVFVKSSCTSYVACRLIFCAFRLMEITRLRRAQFS